MDCLHASEILSAALDGDQVSPGSVAHAREHCARCPECRALLETMDRIASAPHGRAPEQLIARIIDAARAEAEARAESEASAARTAPRSGVVLPLEPVRPRPRTAPAWWKPHFTPLVSAAAVVLVVSAVSTYVLVQMTGPSSQMTTADSTELMLGDDARMSGDEQELAGSPESEDAAQYLGSVQSTPSYVVWEGTVWARTDGAVPRSALTSAGTITSDLGDPDGPAVRDVMVSEAEPGAIFLRGPDEAMIRFSQVARTLGGRPYALAAGTSIPSFGMWPTLPPQFPTPAAADGSPVFVLGGFDDRGRDVFVPPGTDTSGGFALAPGTSPDDPAAGNPNWTWWEPLD
ncbi:MAG: hypothetical protein JW733_06055 [Coriobacteriia bacterium]|nr:hypothetical protein [Coriobacteriia bacterium]MBN2839566.1 hypothetical protein [Coriobacteriia bacterium]